MLVPEIEVLGFEKRMVLAQEPGPIPDSSQLRDQIRCRPRNLVVVGVALMSRRPLPGHETPARRRAHRRRDDRVSKGDTLVDESIQMGRLNEIVAEPTNGIEALLVGINEQDVGSRWDRFGLRTTNRYH